MIGYHALPVITDAYLKGIEGIDPQKALEAMRKRDLNSWFSNFTAFKSIPTTNPYLLIYSHLHLT
jgi:hypothetical protein